MRRIPILLLALLVPMPALAQLRVVTSTTDLWDIARQVGGTRVSAKHISEGYQDPHFVEAKPSFVLDLQKADVWAYVGLDLERGWAPVLLAGARNQRIAQGAPGNIDVSTVIPLLDVPTGSVDRSQGDVHPLGNPHYWLDPANAKRIAGLFRDRFSQLDPAGAASYAANSRAFTDRLDAAEQAWAPALARLKGKP
ncbi:MAG TPA: metal ABC transporter substrate-binding protein, partial [Gemmatimonadales bacterium]|nr:metal ABC transporter substrate-binding protein [Gemmatimonadales bacterium]